MTAPAKYCLQTCLTSNSSLLFLIANVTIMFYKTYVQDHCFINKIAQDPRD